MERELFEFLFQVVVFLFLLGGGYFLGRRAERKHLRSLDEREAALAGVSISDLRTLPANWTIEGDPQLVYGSVVVAGDYFKMVISWLTSLLGGRLPEYESMLNRARREATLRMKQMALDHGCNAVWNVRIETCLMQTQQRRAHISGGAELYVYGTAVRAR